jgi:hypothetical protein
MFITTFLNQGLRAFVMLTIMRRVMPPRSPEHMEGTQKKQIPISAMKVTIAGVIGLAALAGLLSLKRLTPKESLPARSGSTTQDDWVSAALERQAKELNRALPKVSPVRISHKEVFRMQCLFTSSFGSSTDLPIVKPRYNLLDPDADPILLARMHAQPEVQKLVDHFEVLILDRLSDHEITLLPFRKMINMNHFYVPIQDMLTRMALNLAEKRPQVQEFILGEVTRAFETELARCPAEGTYRVFGRFYNGLLQNDQMTARLSPEAKAQLRCVLEITKSLHAIAADISRAYDMSVTEVVKRWREVAPEQEKILEGAKVTIEGIGKWRTIEETVDPVTRNKSITQQGMAYNDGERMLMAVADKIYERVVSARGLEAAWQKIFQTSNAPSNPRGLFAADYQSLILDGTVIDNNLDYIKNTMDARLKFFNEHIFAKPMPKHPSREDLKAQLTQLARLTYNKPLTLQLRPVKAPQGIQNYVQKVIIRVGGDDEYQTDHRKPAS